MVATRFMKKFSISQLMGVYGEIAMEPTPYKNTSIKSRRSKRPLRRQHKGSDVRKFWTKRRHITSTPLNLSLLFYQHII